MAESRGLSAGRIAMRRVEKPNMPCILAAVKPYVKRKQRFLADGWGAYGILGLDGHKVTIAPIPKERLHIDHRWVHMAISLAKRFILGTYHGVSGKYLQSYLDEFCYRWNRRYSGNCLVFHLLHALCFSTPVPYSALTG